MILLQGGISSVFTHALSFKFPDHEGEGRWRPSRWERSPLALDPNLDIWLIFWKVNWSLDAILADMKFRSQGVEKTLHHEQWGDSVDRRGSTLGVAPVASEPGQRSQLCSSLPSQGRESPDPGPGVTWIHKVREIQAAHTHSQQHTVAAVANANRESAREREREEFYLHLGRAEAGCSQPWVRETLGFLERWVWAKQDSDSVL